MRRTIVVRTQAERRTIVVRTQAEGFHRWPEAPDSVKFLRSEHRHIFHATLRMEVFHGDRELEFILVKRATEAYLKSLLAESSASHSCEHLATCLVSWAASTYGDRAIACEVSEDGENGGEVCNHRWLRPL